MSITRKIISIVLSVCLLVSVAVVGVVPVSADSYETYAQDTIQGSAILHCFDWSYNNIKSALPEIAKSGYTAVQTSPVQRPKDYNSSWVDGNNQWWKLYQPLGLSIADGNTWLGTKSELTSLCAEAEKYNIKVVVDIVANHLANNGTSGGGYSNVNSGIDSDLKNADYFHSSTEGISDYSRYTITQYHMGMPDLNTGNNYIQNKVLTLLEDCIDCGVDGFRFDAAKHIELPTDASANCASDFWPTVINGAKTYATTKGVDEPFFYGEILGSAGTNISNYTNYMAVTDNQTGDRALDKAYWTAASELADGTYYKGASADKSVLWVESHDTYMGDSGSAWTGNTQFVTSDVINKAWAIVGARADSTSLFFARPNTVMGQASTDGNWRSTAVSAVNKFKNHFEGTSEQISSSGNVAYIERGTKGVVISKLDGGGQVNLTAYKMANGTYKDQVSGGTFTVSNGVISGNVDSQGVAVVYNAEDDALSYITESTLYLKPNSNWKEASARFAMYVYNASTGANAWADLTDSDNDGYYSADVPSGDWTNVIFVRMNPSSNENRWDAYDGEGHVWNKTNDLFPDTNTNCYTIASGAWSNGDGSWSRYSASQTTTEESTTPSSDTYTIYAINNGNWNNINCYYWNNGAVWPGEAMTSYSGTKVYKYEIPKATTGIIFNNGSSQTVDITSGIADGAVFTINSTKESGKNTVSTETYYLVGSMNGWSNNESYKFTIIPSDSGKLEYKLSGVSLTAGSTLKVHSSDNGWYPGGTGNDYSVTSDGTYDIYFRPDGDGESDWHEGYFYPYKYNTVTWKNGDTVLETDVVSDGETPSYDGEAPTKESTVEKTYTFSGWKKSGDDTLYTDNFPAVTGDVTYTAQFTELARTYTVTWKNYDGTTLDTDEVAYGGKPVYTGETPTRPNDGNTTYAFSGWAPQITDQTTVTGDVTYIARFSTNTQTYTIRWLDGNGNLLKTETCIQGVTPQYTGDTPTKTATDQYSYTFNNKWDPPLVAAERDTDYTAQFDSTVNKYTITWKDGNGNTLKTEELEYGATPAYIGTEPTKDGDADYIYTFNDTWSPEITSVTKNATYTAQFDATDRPRITVCATNVVGWEHVYIYYWTDFGNNSWPGEEMTSDGDNFICSAEIPDNAKGIIFTDGASSDTKQTVNIESGITDGAHWAILNEKDTNETSKYKVHYVPTYYLVGTMTNWGTGGAPTFTPIKNENKLEEYKLSGVELNKNAQIKVYGSNDAWFPGGDNYTVTADGTYDIYFRPNYDGNNDWHGYAFYVVNVTEYTITWIDGDGNTLKTETVTHGDTPEYTGETPTKTATAQYTYTFNNTWSPTIVAATADAEYTAQFTSTVNTYKVTWKNYDGEILETDPSVAYGTMPEYNGDTPTLEATDQYSYSFIGWSPEVNTVTQEIIYTAVYDKIIRSYTITWKDGDGETLKTEDVAYGETPAYTGDTPTKTATDQYSYTFNNTWTPEIVAVTKAATYTAQFDSTLNKYTVTWKNGDETIETDENVTYGSMPIYNGENPAKAYDSQYHYTFAGWDPAVQSVTGNVTYTAAFDSVDHSFGQPTWNWANDNCSATATFTCECGYSFDVTATVGSEITTAATCTETGVRTYTATAEYNGTSYSDTKYETVPATGHNYGQPVWSWAADYSSATATFTCSANDDTQILNAVVTPTYESDKTVYTAKVTFNNVEYTDTQEGDFKLFIGHSLTLEGDIGVNFFLNSAAVGGKNAQVKFSWYDKDPDPVDVVYDETYGMYKATCYVAVAEMTCPITATVYIDGEAQEQQNVYTVKEYADKMLTNEKFINSYKASENAAGRDGNARYAKLKKLIETMLDYGTRAQVRFDVNQEAYANDGTYYDTSEVSITSNPSDMYSNLDKYGLTYVGSSIIYLSKTTLRHYYRVSNTEAFADYEGVIVPSGSRDGMIYFDITNISAPNFGTKYELTLGTEKYYYSVLDYIGKILVSDSFSEESKELGKAADRYYRAAVDYFG